MDNAIFSQGFMPLLLLMVAVAIAGGMFVRRFPGIIDQLALRRIFVVVGVASAFYNFDAAGYVVFVETILQVTASIYFFTIVAEQRLVELPEIWIGKKPAAKK